MPNRTDPRTRASGHGSSIWVRLSQSQLLLIGLAIVVALSLVYLWQSYRWTAAYNELGRAQAELEERQAERQRLTFRVERAFSLERIERIGTEQLNMTRPEPRFLDLSSPDDADQP